MRTPSTHRIVLIALAIAGLALPRLCAAQEHPFEDYRITIGGPGVLLHSSGSGIQKAATDTFYIYGGPGTVEGRFQTELDGGAPDPQGWIGVDLTERTPHWHASQVNSSSIGDGNPKGFTGDAGNHGVISHHDGNDYVGYGDEWRDWLVFGYHLSAGDPGFDPATDNTTVRFTCEYKHYLEELYDYLHFEWNQGGAWQELVAIDGTSYDDSTGYYEKRDFDSDDWGGIVYQPGDYLADGSIELRIRVTSDFGWSDEDGLFTTDGRGAAAVDNIRVYVNGQMVSLADFEHLPVKDDAGEGSVDGHDNGAGPGASGWLPTPSTFVGDFAKIFSNFQDIDVCRDNPTPQFGFINDGTSPSNCPTCPIAPAVSPTWTYGIPGGYVVDYNGGLTNGEESLVNEIWSPVIPYNPDPPNSDTNGGAVLGFTRYTHLPLFNGIFAVWHVRSRQFGQDWSGWEDNNFVYYSPSGANGNFTVDVTDKLVLDPDEVQIAMGVTDFADVFAFPGDDATPAPLFDNIYLKKYDIGGPVFSARTIDLASDCFPIDGTKTGSCRFDANIDRNADVLVPGDSIVAEIKAIIPGSALAEPARGGDLVVAHLLNPDFATERAAGMAAVGGTWMGLDPQTGWDIYTYRVLGQQVTNDTGDIVPNRYFWDLPDGISNGLPHITDEPALLFPGDVLHYYLVSADDLGNATTLPSDIADFGDFTEFTSYDRIYTIRMLPTLSGGDQPGVLFWNDFGHRGGENEYLQAFCQNGMVEGIDYDTYTTKGPTSGVGNGLGSAGYHGATAGQLDGYDCMIYVCGNLSTITISDGTGGDVNDLSADLTTIQAWANADADRYHAYFGDDFAESMVNQGAACQTYLNYVLGVDFLGGDVGPSIDGQTAATIVPTGLGSGSYLTDFVAYGGCLVINDFDEIGRFGGGPVLAHEFTDANENPYASSIAGSIEWNHTDGGGFTKHSIVFPYDLSFVVDSPRRPPSGITSRAVLLNEVFASWAKSPGGPSGCITTGVEDPIDLPDASREFYVGQNHPNPFNPRTRIEFSLPSQGKVRITLYNVRGEKVATLLDEEREAGPGFVDWNGLDARGAEVSSGVYLYKVEAAGREVMKKMALVR